MTLKFQEWKKISLAFQQVSFGLFLMLCNQCYAVIFSARLFQTLNSTSVKKVYVKSFQTPKLIDAVGRSRLQKLLKILQAKKYWCIEQQFIIKIKQLATYFNLGNNLILLPYPILGSFQIFVRPFLTEVDFRLVNVCTIVMW